MRGRRAVVAARPLGTTRSRNCAARARTPWQVLDATDALAGPGPQPAVRVGGEVAASVP
jgi:hypothetical protein